MCEARQGASTSPPATGMCWQHCTPLHAADPEHITFFPFCFSSDQARRRIKEKKKEGESAGLCIWMSLWPRQQSSTEAAFCRAAVHWQCQGEVCTVCAELQRHEEGVLGWESPAAESSSGRRNKVRLCPYGSTVCLLLFACELQRVQYGGGRSLQSAGLCRRAALAQAACCIWGCSGITTIKWENLSAFPSQREKTILSHAFFLTS